MKKNLLWIMAVFALLFAVPAQASDVELIGGGGFWANDAAEGDFLYGEFLWWVDGKYSPGFGIYAMSETGESKLTPYEWTGQLVGPELGVKRTSFDESKLLNQFQLKIRYVWETTEGENRSSGYRMEQDTTKLGGYFEYVGQLDPRWTGSLQLEGWKTLTNERKSTWNEDEAENRDQAMGGMFMQYRVNAPLSVKAGASLFYEGWDDMTGYRVQGEVRLYEHLMVGAYVSVPFAVPDMYKEYGAEVADLTTTGIYGRFEY